MKLIYAAAFALFPLAAPAQTIDSSLLSALCNDDHYEDTTGQCNFTIETILEKYRVRMRGLLLSFLPPRRMGWPWARLAPVWETQSRPS